MKGLIEANSRNRELLLRWEPDAFIGRMKEWAQFYLPADDNPLVVGLTEDDLRGLTAPTLLFAGGDDAHPPEITDRYHELIPGSRLIEPARWDSHQWWTFYERGEHFAVWRELAPEIATFLKQDA